MAETRTTVVPTLTGRGTTTEPKRQNRAGFLLSSVSRKAGGMTPAVSRLVDGILQRVWEVEVFTLADEWTAEDSSAWLPVVPKAFATRGPKAFGYAPELLGSLHAASLDLLHVHGLWMFPSVAALSWHNRTRRPYIISPHGMLDRWALRNALIKKRIAAVLFQRRHLQRAACIHALCAAEAESIRAYGLKPPICMIPSGIDLPDFSVKRAAPWKNTASANMTQERVLLYLGRLHPKKNLHSLLDAWAAIQKSEVSNEKSREWLLVVAGWDQGGYEAQLRERACKLEIEPSVHFVGPLFDEAKAAAYQNADAFVLPSLSEGLPMVVLEAWAYAKPVVMTPECNLPEGFAADAAICIGTRANDIARGLNKLFEMHGSDRVSMGARGRALVAEKFSWPRIGEQMRAVYQWVLGGGAPPETVRLS